MKIRRSITKYSFIAIFLLIISLSVFMFKKVSYKNEIDKILSGEFYSYLPEKAKNYVKEVYESTGEVIRTEKNKVENEPYLNPMFVEYITMSEEEQSNEEIVPMPTIVDYSTPIDALEDSSLSSYDARNVNGKNFVSPLRDQGNLGICWAFASAEVVETYLMKESNTSYSNSSQLVSERQLDYATSIDGIKDYNSEYVSFIEDRVLGDGANFYISSLAMASGTSIFPSNSFKDFDDADLNEEELSDVLSFSKSQYELNESINMPSMNLRESTSNLTTSEKNTRAQFINDVKTYIQNYGSAYVSTYMNSTCYYADTTLNNTVIDVYNCSKSSGHAMQIIGFDDDIEYKYCADNNRHTNYSSSCSNVVSGKGVWILRNSWGSSTTNPYLTYDSLYTQIHFIKNVTSLASKNWDNSYILGEGNGVTTQTFGFSDTRLKGTEKIKKVKFIVASASGTYIVKVYDISGNSHSYTKTVTNPGLVTVDITDDVLVNSSSRITISSGSYYYDRIEIFTSNNSSTKSLDLSAYEGIEISSESLRLYGETKNISSGSLLTYKLFKNNTDVSSSIVITNNEVAENNVNALMSFLSLENGKYTVKVYEGSTLLTSFNFNYLKMEGSGTSSDPYVIMNSTHLRQIENDLGAYYELGADIDLTIDSREGGKYYYQPTGYEEGFGWKPIVGFYGTLDGKGHTIKGLYQRTYFDTNSTTYKMNMQGLFANVLGNLTIKNLVLEDFDISCHENCGALFNDYSVDFNSNPGELTITLDSIALKNSQIIGIGSGKAIGGLAGIINGSNQTTVNISNIYNDSYITAPGKLGYIIGFTGGSKQININNLMLIGKFEPQNSNNSGGISHTLSAGNINIKNVFSTLDSSNISGMIAHTSTIYSYDDIDNTFVIDGINAINIEGSSLFYDNRTPDVLSTSNINLYDKGVNSNELTNASNYSTWSDFNTYWEMKMVSGVSRYPVLKNVTFDYLSVSDINIDLGSSGVSIFDYISPVKEVTKRLIYSVNNTQIATIDSDGLIVPKTFGSTTIHVESLYDGYVRDIPLSVTGDYYIVSFNSNGGSGTMSKMIVGRDDVITLTKNTFVRDGYKFSGWCSTADGSGSVFKDQAVILNLIETGKIYNLYAQWEPIKYRIEYNSNGGFGTMEYQEIEYDKTASLYKNLFSRSNYEFVEWNTKANGTGKAYKNLEDVKNLTKVDGEVINLYAQWKSNITYSFSISSYKVDNNSNIIDLVPAGIDAYTYKQNINTNYRVEVDMKGNSYISTGSELKLYTSDNILYKTYTNIVRGDINGDGRMSALDYIMVKNHIMGVSNINDGIYKKAADVNNDGKISALDYVNIKNKIMGG